MFLLQQTNKRYRNSFDIELNKYFPLPFSFLSKKQENTYNMAKSASMLSYRIRFLEQDWLQSTTVDPYLQIVLNGRLTKNSQKKQYGILDFPSIPPGLAEVTFGIEVDHRSSGELSDSIASFLNLNTTSAKDNAGMHLNNIYWPVKAQNENICLFKLQFWECNDHYFRRFSYISSALMERTNVTAIIINRGNRNSLDNAHHLTSELSKRKTPVVAFVTDGEYGCQISDQELYSISRENNMPMFSLPSQHSAINSVKYFYHSLCDFLYGLRFGANRFPSNSQHSLVLPVVSQGT